MAGVNMGSDTSEIPRPDAVAVRPERLIAYSCGERIDVARFYALNADGARS